MPPPVGMPAQAGFYSIVQQRYLYFLKDIIPTKEKLFDAGYDIKIITFD